MKKIYAWVICLLLIAAVAVPVLAAGTVQLTLNPSTANVSRGDSIEFTVNAEVDSCKSGGIEITYDTGAFELVSGEWALSGAFMTDFDVSTRDGVFAFAEAAKLSGGVFRFVLKVKDNASFGSANVSVSLTVDGTAAQKSASITVACAHSYSNSCDTSCNTCGATRTITHSYDNSCDTSCNVCGETRAITHSYSTKWSSDGSKHWHACSVCGDRKDEASHTPGAAATEYSAQTCTICGYVLSPALGHTHKYEDTLTYDVMGHWYECSDCDEIKDYKNHTFDNDCDTTCDTCGYVREAQHIYQERWMSDETGHWHECTVCGDRLETEPHIPGPEATAESAQICIACGYELAPMLGHTHTYEGEWKHDDTGHWQECSCGHASEKAEHSWDEGVVTREPTDTVAGLKTYSCTVCGAEKTENISVEQQTPGNDHNPPEEPTVPPAEEPGFPWWIVIVCGAVLVIGCSLFLIIGIIIGKKQTGKFSAK